MADEDVAPSRAEIEAWLWYAKENKATPEDIEKYLIHFLKDRGVSDIGIGKVLTDIQTYRNYPVEEPVEDVEESSGENS